MKLIYRSVGVQIPDVLRMLRSVPLTMGDAPASLDFTKLGLTAFDGEETL
jgi:hypothetical protein